MTRAEAYDLVAALEEWMDARDELDAVRKRVGRGTPEAERAFETCEATRERLIDVFSGEDRTVPLAGRDA